MKLRLLLLFCSLCATEHPIAQPGLAGELRAAVYRVAQQNGVTGTALMMDDSGKMFLVTNRHVVQDSSGGIRDSIFIFVNKEGREGEVLSDSVFGAVRLRDSMNSYYLEPRDRSVDLIVIPFGPKNVGSNLYGIRFKSLKRSALIDSKRIDLLLSSNPIVTVIGYPGKDIPLVHFPRYPEYRWGRITGWNERFVQTDVPVVPGSSGSPVLVEKDKLYWFVGIVSMKVGDQALAEKASAILQQFDEVSLKEVIALTNL